MPNGIPMRRETIIDKPPTLADAENPDAISSLTVYPFF